MAGRNPRCGPLFALLLCLAMTGAPWPAAAQTEPAPPAGHDPGHGQKAAPAAKLYDNLGSYHRAITTASPEAQRWFDQGLRLLFAFNLEEAQRSFEEAARIDPACAMCFWGVGMSLGPHINLPGQADRTEACQSGGAACRRSGARRQDDPRRERPDRRL